MEITKPTDVVDERYPNTPIGIVRSRDAFLRDLPALLANPRYDRWLALYCGDECIGIAESHLELLRERERRGLQRDEYYLGIIEPYDSDEEIEGALSFVEYDDDAGTFAGPPFENGHSAP